MHLNCMQESSPEGTLILTTLSLMSHLMFEGGIAFRDVQFAAKISPGE